MKLNELISEQQLDELTAGDVARGAGKVVKGVATGAGAVAGAAVGAGKAFMKGYRGARDAIGGAKPQANAQIPKNILSAIQKLDAAKKKELLGML
jgi:hypothetical protein